MDRGVVDANPLDENIPLGGLLQPGHHSQQGGFPASRGTQQGHQRALFDVEIHFFDGDNLAESFQDTFKLHHGLFLAGSHVRLSPLFCRF